MKRLSGIEIFTLSVLVLNLVAAATIIIYFIITKTSYISVKIFFIITGTILLLLTIRSFKGLPNLDSVAPIYMCAFGVTVSLCLARSLFFPFILLGVGNIIFVVLGVFDKL